MYLNKLFVVIVISFVWLSCSESNHGSDVDLTPKNQSKDSSKYSFESESNVLFHDDSVVRFEVFLDSLEWERLKKHAKDEEYTPVNFVYGDDTLNNVGLRFKGAWGTLKNCIKADSTLNDNCPKLSMKLKFSEYDKSQRFMGLKRLNLHSMIGDSTKLHDKLGYSLFREMGVEAPRSGFSNFFVNGKNMGLYALVEQVDGRFSDSRWTPGEGNIYKEVWPKGSGETQYYEALKTNEETPNVKIISDFQNSVNKAASTGDKQLFESIVSIENTLAYLVTDLVIENIDGYRTWYCVEGWKQSYDICRPHNFYWYENIDEQLILIPWDLDQTFSLKPFVGNVPDWNDLSEMCLKQSGLMEEKNFWHPGCDPYFRMLAMYYDEEYKEKLADFLLGAFEVKKVQNQISKWVKTIKPYVDSDPFLNKEKWNRDVADFILSIPILNERATKYLSKDTPDVFGMNLQGIDFESGSLIASWPAEGLDVIASVDSISPFGESNDLEFNFDVQAQSIDRPIKLGTWMIPFDDQLGHDLEGLSNLCFKIGGVGLKELNLYVGLVSKLYIDGITGKAYNWRLTDLESEDRVCLDLTDIGFSNVEYNPVDYGEPSVDDVLKELYGIRFVLDKKEGTNSLKGELHIDDIEFVY